MGCPNRVKPFELVRYLRKEMIRSKRIGSEITVAHFRLMVQFQRVRYRAIRRAMHYQEAEISQREWYQWMGIPIRQTVFKEIEISGRKNTEKTLFPRKHTSNACLFCSECSNCCPISFERSTYDPQVIIRKFNLGMFEELLQSPMIWMCLECRTCSQICSQLVRGHELIRALRQLAIQSGRVDSDLPGRLFEVDRNIYPRLLDEIDQLCGMFGLKPDHS
jgi:heterodisulfide reductase subunit C